MYSEVTGLQFLILYVKILCCLFCQFTMQNGKSLGTDRKQVCLGQKSLSIKATYNLLIYIPETSVTSIINIYAWNYIPLFILISN